MQDVGIKIDRFSMTATPVSMMDEANKLLEAGDYKGYVEALAWMGLQPLPIPLSVQEFNLNYIVENLTPIGYFYSEGEDPELARLKAAVATKLSQMEQAQRNACSLYDIFGYWNRISTT